MKNLAFLLFVAQLIFLSCVFSLPHPADSEVFKGFDPLEWSDDYVFLPTNNPQQIQVWNSKSKKLVYTYKLTKNVDTYGKNIERALTITDMSIIDKDIWLSCDGITRNLIKINVPTGEVKYINQKNYFYSIQADKTWENGKGCLWGMNFCQPNDGFTVWQYDFDGNLLYERKIDYIGLDVPPLRFINYVDDNYFILGSSDWDIDSGRVKKDEFFKIIKLNGKDGGVVKNFSLDTLLTEKIYQDLKLDFEDFGCALGIFKAKYNEYLELNLVGFANEVKSAKFLCKIKDWTSSKIEVEYTGINYQDDESRAISTIAENEENIFLSGRVLYGGDFSGLETGAYSKATGKELYRMRMPSSNQLHYEIKDDKTWFPQDVNEQDENYDWYSIPKGCYMLDHKTGKTYWYDENGNEKEMEQMVVVVE